MGESETGYLLIQGDARHLPIADGSVHCVVTSPPYFGLRDYGSPGQIGLEPTPEEYVTAMVGVFREVWRVLRDDGCLWLNLGDSYANDAKWGGSTGGKHVVGLHGTPVGRAKRATGLKPKDRLFIPHRVALALQADGWYARDEIIWDKANPMPESVTDRTTKAHEFIFLFTKGERYYYDADAIKEEGTGREPGNKAPHKFADENIGRKGTQYRRGLNLANTGAFMSRNARSVWRMPMQPFSGSIETSRQVRVAMGVLSGGMTHRVSSDCPVHASWDHPDSNPECGERASGQFDHIEHTDYRHAQGPPHGSFPIGPRPEPPTQQQTLGSLLLPCSPIAIDHSNQNHKTALDPGTIPPCKPFDQTPVRIGGTSTEHGFELQRRSKPASNTSASGSGGDPSSKTSRHSTDRPLDVQLSGASVESLNERGCTCSFYTTITENTSHFATFPPSLPERCIKAGTSEAGCCPSCGSPYARLTERTKLKRERPNDHVKRTGAEGTGNSCGNTVAGTSVKTLGWGPTCRCDAGPPDPCVVFDPFSGAATTGIVAARLGRRYVGTDLSRAYLEMSARRIADGLRPRSKLDPRPFVHAAGQRSFFEPEAESP